MKARSLWSALKQAKSGFVKDDAKTLSASLAFYSALALSPLLVLFLTITSLLGSSTQREMIDSMQQFVGPDGNDIIETVMDNAKDRGSAATLAEILSLATLAFSATTVFAQLQHSLNRIWDVQIKADGYKGWLRKRWPGLVLIIVIGLLLLFSVIVSAALGVILDQSGWIWKLVSSVVNLIVLLLLFALTFKYLPDVNVAWRSVWVGAAFTAVLFALGRYLFGLYLSYSSLGSAYGAAGSLIVMLLWIYYSAAIVLLGAELTQAYAIQSGEPIKLSEHAEWLPNSHSKQQHTL